MVQDLIAEALRAIGGALGSRSPGLGRSDADLWPARARPPGATDGGADDLIVTLVADLRPATFRSLPRRLGAATGLGMLIAALVLGGLRGFQPGPMEAAMAVAVSVKVGYALAVGTPSLWAAARLARPEGEGHSLWAWIAGPLVLLSAVALGRWLHAPAAARTGMLVGSSAMACPAWIALASLPSLVGLLRIMRLQAPTRPGLTGALLGLSAGCAGALAYAIFCRETSLGFIAIWYTAGLAGAVAIGALLGAWLLRW
jgi:hypothetical protein